jgi:hypothetical protein
MSGGGKRAKGKNMVVWYGEEYDCGVWARCDGEEFEREVEEFEDKILYLAECESGYRECGVDNEEGEYDKGDWYVEEV